MCPHTPNDFSLTSYIGFMKSLINHPNDVKLLRSNHILLNKLNSDEELAKMYAEMSIPTVNNAIFMSVQERMQEHYNSRCVMLESQSTQYLRGGLSWHGKDSVSAADGGSAFPMTVLAHIKKPVAVR
ncbi:hypothetical protein RJ639_005147 [Escallonia herrerae]|uniref:Uncharacterized protein n=1 Tax=Escallonia herrerae TaxID=1293975 RepID=A0AA88W4X4_9ASTE|nr:hypothetical protein RJ639_005147 [Escallonia herrerae]